MPKLYAKILDQGETYWNDLMKHARAIDAEVTEDDVVEILELLNADGSVIIENRDLTAQNWIVRATI
jgi:hypothetical protein